MNLRGENTVFLSTRLFSILNNLSRRKPPPTSSPRGFSRCLSTYELTSLGVGAILGAGIYVVTGQVAASIAGPSTFLSFIIAAFASILSGLAYAEFGARVPRTSGSAYAYSYVAVGEIWAFVIGWNLVLEYMIGTAADASALSASIENLACNFFGNVSGKFYPFPPLIGDHRPDIFAFILTLMVTFLLAIGVRDSSRCTFFCNVINGFIVLFIVLLGSFYADSSRWKGYKNFFPYGINGAISGAASCFYAFVGFDIIATTGEEAADASKSIPIAIVSSLIIVLISYLSVTAVVTMMVPYYELEKGAPLASAFSSVGLRWAGSVISLGAMFGLTSSLIGSLFPLPRIVFSMANDGLLFSYFSKINAKSEVPVNATVFPGILTAFFALFFDLEDLVEMMSIGTLLAYTLVSFCILILRYQPTLHDVTSKTSSSTLNEPMYRLGTESDENVQFSNETRSFDTVESFINNIPITNKTTIETYVTAIICSTVIFLCVLVFAVVVLFTNRLFQKKNWWVILVLALILIVIIISFAILQTQPQNIEDLSFKVIFICNKAPCVPALPVLAIVCNIFLILKLSTLTWIRFSIWMFIGIIVIDLSGFMVYVFYSYRFSKVGQNPT
ncbi:Cationic amino acid transporter 2 [Thelohanellus kitauei]|uniref:Cationic amino acid transporter 2 n=1 Tax=Thelohanellus kitauei TaxID=669202 RepID=A0A0C2MX20_THEKT|nr:Cationic amino acid transporter 2 [Thelohanellus kitauei]